MPNVQVGADGTLSAGVLHSLTDVFDAPGNRSQRLGDHRDPESSSTRFHVPHLRLLVTAWQSWKTPSKRHQFGAGPRPSGSAAAVRRACLSLEELTMLTIRVALTSMLLAIGMAVPASAAGAQAPQAGAATDSARGCHPGTRPG